MLIFGDDVIGGIKLHPAQTGDVERKPCVRSIGTKELWHAKGWNGFDVATEVFGWQSDGAKRSDGKLCKVLTDPFFSLKNLLNRCRHITKACHESEVLKNAVHKLLRCIHKVSVRGKRTLGILDNTTRRFGNER